MTTFRVELPGYQDMLQQDAEDELVDEQLDELRAAPADRACSAKTDTRPPLLPAAVTPPDGSVRVLSLRARNVRPLLRGSADCHPYEAAAARIDGRRLCHDCLHAMKAPAPMPGPGA